MRQKKVVKEYPAMSYKRAFDIVCASAGALVFFPVLVSIAVMIRIEDGGPVFFKQERLGRDKRPFSIIKFRSMRDGKVTAVGRWIRSTGLDEVMQFINVLKGDMSMVGPRPLTLDDAHRLGWDDDGRARFSVKPGITGLSQLYAGKGVRVSAFLEQKYIERASFTLDMKIIALSFLVNLFGKRRIKLWLARARKRSNRKRLTPEPGYSRG